MAGWVLDEGTTKDCDLDYLEAFESLFARLPSDTVAMELGARAVTCYWLEEHPTDAATVDALHEVMADLGRQLCDRDEQIAAEIEDGNS